MDDKIWKKFRKEILKKEKYKDCIFDIFIYGIVTILSDSKNAVF